jgi:hypothetical protein
MKHYSGIKANHMHQVVELLTSSPLSKLQLSGEGGHIRRGQPHWADEWRGVHADIATHA